VDSAGIPSGAENDNKTLRTSGTQENFILGEKERLLTTAIQFICCFAGAKTLDVWRRWSLAVSRCIQQERRFLFIKTNIIHQLKQYNTTGHKAHFISGVNCHMFWHQGAIIRQFYQKQNLIGPTSISGDIHPHFHDKN
jgi:hypothetical protein